jgi:hypothetical protein
MYIKVTPDFEAKTVLASHVLTTSQFVGQVS